MLPLAARAPEPEPFLARRPLLAPPDRGSAAPARPAGASVYPALPAGPGVPGRPVPQPLLVGVKQPVPELHQGGQVLDVAGRPRRIDAAQEQRFRHVDSPEASDVALVEQRLADRAAAVRGEAAGG